MRKDWNLIPLILANKKTVETRWYMTKRAPWGRIEKNDWIYFKDSGQPITARAKVKNVTQMEIDSEFERELWINKLWEQDLVHKQDLPKLQAYARDKRFLVAIYLKAAEATPPYQIDKSGFGLQSAWITLPSIFDIVINK